LGECDYGGLFNLTLSDADGWAALDALVFSVIPATGLPVSVGGSTKELLVNRFCAMRWTSTPTISSRV
jgi:hypothetical protein